MTRAYSTGFEDDHEWLGLNDPVYAPEEQIFFGELDFTHPAMEKPIFLESKNGFVPNAKFFQDQRWRTYPIKPEIEEFKSSRT